MIFWDPPQEVIPYVLPLLGRPLLWYGFFFALAFFAAYWVLRCLLASLGFSIALRRQFSDQLTLYIVLGTLIGARLGDILLYQHVSYYLEHPLAIFQIWQGGLASHGGAVGILVALALFYYRNKKKYPAISFFRLIDLLGVVAPLSGALIRIGNLFNQEILGTVTQVPWAFVFGHPADGTPPAPRHPVQLYESLYYFLTFGVLAFLWKKGIQKREGLLAGLSLSFIFLFRLFIEQLKEEQSVLLGANNLLTMGQILSLPLLLLGVYLILFAKRRRH